MAGFWKPGSAKPPRSIVDDDEDDVPFQVPSSSNLSSSSAYMSIETYRHRLPVYKHRTAILYLVHSHATTIIQGETGSGKTTQLPQYLAEAGWAQGGRLIACTQPRRLAAQTVASRVAEEMRVALGQDVGYSIRFEEVCTAGITKIKYLTDGVLLREMMEDPLLSKYSVIMVDEAHERSISTDLLLGLLKKIQRRRPDLRLIVASATLEARSIAGFFDTTTDKRSKFDMEATPSRKPAITSVEGRAFVVQLFYLEEPASDYIRAAVSAVLEINEVQPPGDILVFLTGQDDIDAAVQLINDESDKRRKSNLDLLALPLYAGLPRSDQELVFGATPRGKRKVIVATNIAETSVTLEGIVYVVDSGFAKQRFYNPLTDVEALVVAPISKASAQQRAGRAGRVRPGKCYRLYTEDTFKKEMPDESIPDIQRSNLVSTVLQLKALGIDNIMQFDWLAPPSPQAMIRALETLYAIGVLDADAKLSSPTGFQIAEIPLDPLLSKMLLSSVTLGCSHEVLTIAATLSVKSIWVSSKGRQRELDEVRDHFAVAEGDHITYLNVYEAFLRSQKSSQWCHRNCINYQAMKKVTDIRSQLSKLLERLGLSIKSCGRETEPIRKSITAGFFAHVCQLKMHSEVGCYQTIRGRQEVFIHPSSVLFRVTPKWVIYNTLVTTERQYMREVTAIESEWLTELAPHFFQRNRTIPSS